MIILDDFLEEPGWQHEMHKAFFEFVEIHNVKFDYIAYSISTPSSSVGVVIKSINEV